MRTREGTEPGYKVFESNYILNLHFKNSFTSEIDIVKDTYVFSLKVSNIIHKITCFGKTKECFSVL